jgi:hypothetical protein
LSLVTSRGRDDLCEPPATVAPGSGVAPARGASEADAVAITAGRPKNVNAGKTTSPRRTTSVVLTSRLGRLQVTGF